MKFYLNSDRQTKSLIKIVGTLLAIFITAFFLSGCEQSKPTQPLIKKPAKKYSKATTLKGTVNNDLDKVVTGIIKVNTEEGKIIAKTELQNNNHFAIEIPANTLLPIILTFYPKKQTSSDQLVAVAVDPFIKTYNITPRTTAIAEQAKLLGGYSHSNMVQAANNAVNAPGRNRTTAGFRGDPTKQYGGWH